MTASTTSRGRIPNALPFVSAKDPRVPTVAVTSPKPFDAVTPLRLQQIFPARSDPVPLVSGIDARLIEAETKFQAGDYAGDVLDPQCSARVESEDRSAHGSCASLLSPVRQRPRMPR